MFAVASIVEAPESSEGATDSHLRMVLITTFSKGVIPLPCERSYRTILTFVQDPPAHDDLGRRQREGLKLARLLNYIERFCLKQTTLLGRI